MKQMLKCYKDKLFQLFLTTQKLVSYYLEFVSESTPEYTADSTNKTFESDNKASLLG